MAKSALVQLETQGRLTLALLPLVSALPLTDEDVIVRVFGQAMSILNWSRSATTFVVPEALAIPKSQLERRTPRTKEEKREYWRLAQRMRRRRLKVHELEKQRSELDRRIRELRKTDR